jgi:glucosamine-6-phosphate deaminase
MPYIVVDNFPGLGLMTALRFLEWVAGEPRRSHQPAYREDT